MGRGGEGDKDADHPDNQKLVGDEKSMENGPAGTRRCTDMLCILLLVACWCAMTGVGFAALGWIDGCSAACADELSELNVTSWANTTEVCSCEGGLPKGNPYRLTNGVDYNGHLCGFSEPVANKPYIYYLMSGEGVCVESCPSSTDYESFICTYEYQESTMDPAAEVSSGAESIAGFAGLSSGSCLFKLECTAALGYCVPSAAVDAAAASASEYAGDNIDANTTFALAGEADDGDVWDAFCADMFEAAWMIFGFGFGFACVASFVYTWLMRIPGVLALVIWGLLTAIQVLIILLAGLCYTTFLTWSSECTMPAGSVEVNGTWYTSADDLYDDVTLNCASDDNPVIHTPEQAQAMSYLAYFVLACAVIWFVLIFCVLRKRIMLAIAVVKEAGRALSAQKLLIFFPIIQLLGVMAFVAPWTVYVLFLASSGEIVTQISTYEYMGETVSASYKQYEFSDTQQYAGLYLLFTWFWTSQFVVAMGQLVVALAISTWYFKRDKTQIGSANVFWSIKTAFRYHFGSAAFGSLIIAIIKTIRAVVAYLQKKAKKSGNKLAMLVLCAIQCCMWCVEKTMKFINKNAYIQIAIFGYSFCKAARKAFFLILRNILRISAVSIVSSFVLLIGKVLVPVGTTCVAYLALLTIQDRLTGIWAPLFFTFVLSFFTVEMFNEVFGMAIWTILQCFVADEEMFGTADSTTPMFADGSLKDCISTTQKAAQKLDQEKVHPAIAAKEAAPAPDAPPDPIP